MDDIIKPKDIAKIEIKILEFVESLNADEDTVAIALKSAAVTLESMVTAKFTQAAMLRALRL